MRINSTHYKERSMNIVNKKFAFTSAPRDRSTTDCIVVHHSGTEEDMDLGAEQIHQGHLNNGWIGIGYHYVIRKNGDIETGRPDSASGAHCEGENWHTIGIHVAGNFMLAEPTKEQLAALKELMLFLCAKYDIPFDREHIVGHREYDATACPGDNLYNKLDEICASN